MALYNRTVSPGECVSRDSARGRPSRHPSIRCLGLPAAVPLGLSHERRNPGQRRVCCTRSARVHVAKRGRPRHTPLDRRLVGHRSRGLNHREKSPSTTENTVLPCNVNVSRFPRIAVIRQSCNRDTNVFALHTTRQFSCKSVPKSERGTKRLQSRRVSTKVDGTVG